MKRSTRLLREHAAAAARFDVFAVPRGGVIDSRGMASLSDTFRAAQKLVDAHSDSELRAHAARLRPVLEGNEPAHEALTEWLKSGEADSDCHDKRPSHAEWFAILALVLVQDAIRTLAYPASSKGLRRMLGVTEEPEARHLHGILAMHEQMRRALYASRFHVADYLGVSARQCLERAQDLGRRQAEDDVASAEKARRSAKAQKRNELRHAADQAARNFVRDRFDRQWAVKRFKDGTAAAMAWLPELNRLVAQGRFGKRRTPYELSTVVAWIRDHAREQRVPLRRASVARRGQPRS